MRLRPLFSALVFAAALTASCGPPPVSNPDAGVPSDDAGVTLKPDAGDAGQDPDAGEPPDAGGDVPDSGTPTAPDTELLSGPQGRIADASATFEFTATVANATFECRLDQGAFAPCTSPHVLTALPDGQHLFIVRASADGLTDPTPPSRLWTVDTSPPETTITQGPFGTVSSTTAEFFFEASEANSTFVCALDGAAFSACTSPVTYTQLALGAHTFEVAATDDLGHADATPDARAWSINPNATTRLRIVASNLTSGNLQSYDPGHGLRILQGLSPDVVLMQEFNYGDNTQATMDAVVTSTFGQGFVWAREPGSKQIPNGVISRYPIVASGAWDDPQVSNREFAWAHIDLPGTQDLWAVSVHLLTSSSSTRNTEAQALRNFINANVPAGDYLVVGGDFNTDSRTEACISTLSTVVHTSSPYPVDNNGNGGTNASRSKPYDWVLVDADLFAHQVPVAIGQNAFTNGLVVDTTVYTPLADLAPAQYGDSTAPSMQHMAVVKDFVVPN